MKRVPLWVLGLLAVISVLFIVVGSAEVHEAGYLPVVAGVLWAVFVLASLPRAFSDD